MTSSVRHLASFTTSHSEQLVLHHRHHVLLTPAADWWRTVAEGRGQRGLAWRSVPNVRGVVDSSVSRPPWYGRLPAGSYTSTQKHSIWATAHCSHVQVTLWHSVLLLVHARNDHDDEFPFQCVSHAKSGSLFMQWNALLLCVIPLNALKQEGWLSPTKRASAAKIN